MPWTSNNNPAGEVRAPAFAAAVKQQQERDAASNAFSSEWNLNLRMISLEELLDHQNEHVISSIPSRYCALVHPNDFPSSEEEAVNTLTLDHSVAFVYPRSHAQFVIPIASNPIVPSGSIALTSPMMINLELCDGATESWSIYSTRSPSIQAIAIEIRPLDVSDSDASDDDNHEPIHLDAHAFSTAFKKFTWQRILTENERISFKHPATGHHFFVRVIAVAAEDEHETDFTMPQSYRGIIDDDTKVLVTTDGNLESLKLSGGASDAEIESLTNGDYLLSSDRSDIVTVLTNDEEEFPVKKKLLFPCIKLSSAVLSGAGVHKEASSVIEVDVDTLTFDRVLLYLEHEARQTSQQETGDYQFDPAYTEQLLNAATTLGCIGLEEVCRKRLGEFETRVRKDPIRYEEVLRRNENGEVILVMQGMVFDVTRWIPEHPGGSVIISTEAVNVDCTVMFEIYHASRQSFRYLKQFYIGEIADVDLASIPNSTEPPSDAFIQELKQYTTWRVTPTEPTFKSF